jgi:N-glycosylase/DNA lyase
MKEILNLYKKDKKKINSTLISFKNKKENEIFNEFMFCLLTPQSNAKKCWEAVEQISKLKQWNKQNINQILKTKTRFHNVKTSRILNSKNNFLKIKPLLEERNILKLRNEISKQVNGYGLKEASHFLRNIGLSNNKIAILDRHILRNMKSLNIINQEKIKSNKEYLEIEQKYLEFSKILNIPADKLDLLFWSKETGELFK